MKKCVVFFALSLLAITRLLAQSRAPTGTFWRPDLRNYAGFEVERFANC